MSRRAALLSFGLSVGLTGGLTGGLAVGLAGCGPKAARLDVPPAATAAGLPTELVWPVDVGVLPPVAQANGVVRYLLRSGYGEPAAAADKRLVHVVVWGQDGRKLSSTRDKSKPIPLDAGAPLLAGLDAPLSATREGERVLLVVPPALGSVVGFGGGWLFVEVETVAIQRAEAAAPAPVTDVMAAPLKLPVDVRSLTPERRPSGLVIYTLTEGSGEGAALGEAVAIHYAGALADGTVFDASRPRGEPLLFRTGDGMVIAGFDEGVLGMKVGERRLLLIPPEIGYGGRTKGPIPANSILVFDIERVALPR